MFWPSTVRINCSSDLKNFANSRPSASDFKSFSGSLENFFLTVGQNNFGNKIYLHKDKKLSNLTDLTPISTKMISKLQAWPVLLHHHLSKLIMYTFLNQLMIVDSYGISCCCGLWVLLCRSRPTYCESWLADHSILTTTWKVLLPHCAPPLVQLTAALERVSI